MIKCPLGGECPFTACEQEQTCASLPAVVTARLDDAERDIRDAQEQTESLRERIEALESLLLHVRADLAEISRRVRLARL